MTKFDKSFVNLIIKYVTDSMKIDSPINLWVLKFEENFTRKLNNLERQ